MKKILIVDDSRETAEVLSLILEMNGYQEFWAANGADGLQKVGEVTPDLVMLDYMMPLMNGAAMCEALRAQYPSLAIKVLVHTCLAESAVNARFGRYDAYLRKPYEVEGALKLIQQLLEAA
jgi:CheY-like chemotaxis protein